MLDWVIYIGLLFWSNTTKLEIKDDGGGGEGLSETLIENIRQNRTLCIGIPYAIFPRFSRNTG